LKIAYFINQYPKVSHSFIRREILALEGQGFDVMRIALRGWRESLPDRDDLAEQARTHYVLRNGVAPVLIDALRVMMQSPWRFIKAAHLAIRMVRGIGPALGLPHDLSGRGVPNSSVGEEVTVARVCMRISAQIPLKSRCWCTPSAGPPIASRCTDRMSS
jgi:hypothetical protein